MQTTVDVRSERASGHRPRPAAPARVASALAPRNASAIYVLALFFIVFGLWVPDTFLSWDTIRAVLSEQAITALLAIGLVIPLAAGAFDLSVANTLGFASVLSASLMAKSGLSWPVAAGLTLAAGAAVGALNAWLVVGLSVQSMIATLAMSSVVLGVGSAIGGNDVVVGLPSGFTDAGAASPFGVALPVYILFATALVLWYVLRFTTVGRYIYATGGGAEAARLSGVRTNRIVIGSLVVAGLLAAFAGVVATARVGAGQSTIGPPYLLPAFAAVFLGATQFGRGQFRFNVWGTVVATYTLAFGVKGLQLAGAPIWLPDVFNGVALAVAVALGVRESRAFIGRRRQRPRAAAAPA